MIRLSRSSADAGALGLAASILLAGLLIAGPAHAAPAGAVAVGAPAAQSPVVNYVALGDSYAAGQGAGFYDNACLQSDLSYPEMLDDDKHVKLVTDASCSGATTTDVLGQLAALKKNKHVDLITLTVGANDLGVGAISAACTVSFTSPQCQAALAAARALLTPPAPGVPSELAVRLATTFTAVAAAAPDATILVTGYPYLFETPPPTDPNYAIISQLNAAMDLLNGTIAGVVQRLALTGVDIHYVDVTDDFAGHSIGSTQPWIHASGPDAFHPTAAGYAAYTTAIRSEL
ncbi:SGNH/GDSL hydrolase family protein [Mycetocola sp. 2940]|uniref:SGNH/GDSL hydrolase family protein n=1 Tax=Mycetocola sp. 2940 TaxID=3156452 RepID=UPI003394201E